MRQSNTLYIGLDHTPSDLVVESFSCSLISSRREDLQIKPPVVCRYSSALDFHATAAGVLGPTLVGDEVVAVRSPRATRLLAPAWMVKAVHREQLPLDGVMGLIQHGARHRHLRGCEDRRPARVLLLHPAPPALAVSLPRRSGEIIGKVAEPLTQRKHPQALALSGPVQQGVELGAQGRADRGGAGRQWLRELAERVAETIAHARSRGEHAQTLGGAVEAVGQDPSDPIRGVLVGRRALERLRRLGTGGRTGVLGAAQVPADTTMDNRRQIHFGCRAVAVLLIGQEIGRERGTTPSEDGDQTLAPKGTDPPVEGHGGEMGDHGAPRQTEATVGRQQGIAGHLGSPLAIAQDKVRQDGEHGVAGRALDAPDGRAIQAHPGRMGVAWQAPAATTGGLMCELNAKGHDEGEDTFADFIA
jgi:hypothetical protein